MEKIVRSLSVLFAVFLAGCAGQIPPSGGPVDKTPPKIVMSSPSPNQLNFTSDQVRIKFDKYMVERTVESSLYFPPFGLSDLKIDWSGKEMRIHVEKPFEKDRTYILTIGARSQDTHGNYLGKAYNIVFSTGSKIDTGTVVGNVYAPKAQPYTVAAYEVTPDIDTLRPNLTLPEYLTQSDDSGSYSLQGLADGKYRLICFDDQMRNYMYAPQLDLYASATHDVEVTSEKPTVNNIDFAVAKEDTSHPQLYSAALANDGLLLLKLSEPLDPLHLLPSDFVVRDSASGDTLPVDFAVRLESNEYNVAIRTVRPVQLHRKYFVTATDSLRDLQQNHMSRSNHTVTFTPDSASAVVNPYFFNFADSLKGVTAYDTLFCQFVIPDMNGKPTDPHVSLVDTSGKPLKGLVTQEPDKMFKIDTHALSPSKWYTVRLTYASDVKGAAKDSVVKRRFMTIDSTTIGELKGKVVPVVHGRQIVVDAQKKGGKSFYTLADTSGNFRLDEIPAGTYTVRAYVKRGPGMGYFNGRSYPFQFAEPFCVYQNPVKIRARWTTEGVAIRLH